MSECEKERRERAERKKKRDDTILLEIEKTYCYIYSEK